MTIPERDAAILELRASGLSQLRIASRLGLSNRIVERTMARLRASETEAQATGGRVLRIHHKAPYAPVEIPEGHYAPLTTVQYDAAGIVVNEWRRLAPEQQALIQLADRLAAKVKGKAPKVGRRAPKIDGKALLQETVLSDPHIGMYAWPDETGHFAYDSKTATETVSAAIADAVSKAKPAVHVLIFNGDILHADSRRNQTELSGNVLDVDTRWSKVLEHAEAIMVDAVRTAADHAAEVRVVVNPGNHDWHTAHALGRILSAYWHNEPRIQILNNARPRKSMVWGKTLLAWAHGDKVKPADWAKLIPTEFPEDWGATRYRYLHLGHIHHSKAMAPVVVDEQAGLTVEYLRSLCPLDAWHAESGYIGSMHGCDSFLYSQDWGMEARWFFNAEKVWLPQA
jgi:UDP-2,3-diacylglucosamine pyrophosphatase LpxH